LGTSSAVQLNNNFVEGEDQAHQQSLAELKVARARIDRLEELEAMVESNSDKHSLAQ